MDFRFPPELAWPLAVSLAFPLTLFVAARRRAWRERNDVRFFAAAVFQSALLVIGAFALAPEWRPRSAGDWLCGAMLWLAFMLFYLEVWGLMSRGYTLAMLIVLLRSPRPLSAAEIAREYRGGAGLGWIMEHRTRGLQAAGVIDKTPAGDVILTTSGAWIVHAYAAARAAFGLRNDA